MATVPDSVRRAKPLLGTFVEITVLNPASVGADDAIDRAFAAIARVHRLMSFHDSGSDVSRMNRRAASKAVAVDPWTFEVLQASVDFHRRSAGAFDITVANVLQAIGLLPRHDQELSPLSGTRQAIDTIELLGKNRVRFQHPAVGIDLGGIAKGYAVDRAVETLKAHGVQSGVVNAGGDLAAFGPDRHVVDIRDPLRPDRILSRTAIRDQAIASSGGSFDPSRSFAVTGLAVIDPATQRPATAIVGATVRAASCMIADALTKIVMVLGEDALAVLDHYRASAILVSRDGTILRSDTWKEAVHDAA